MPPTLAELDWRLLAPTTGMPEPAVLAALRAAVDVGLLATGQQLSWSHALTRDTVLATLLPPERAVLARRAAQVLAEWAGPDDEPRAAQLFAEAGEPDAAAELCQRLARAAGGHRALEGGRRLRRAARAARTTRARWCSGPTPRSGPSERTPPPRSPSTGPATPARTPRCARPWASGRGLGGGAGGPAR